MVFLPDLFFPSFDFFADASLGVEFFCLDTPLAEDEVFLSLMMPIVFLEKLETIQIIN